MANVTVIPASIKRFSRAALGSNAKRKVAAYSRVSTNSEEQATSFAAQVDYYTRYICSRPDWEFVSVYTDEGISGTNTRHRDGFNAMIRDAFDGKIDLIVTKSVSRFARNTVDSLNYVRSLKAHGCEVFFEKENIYTFDSKGELMITIMSSLAQEESRSISENIIWGKRKQFADGKVSLAYKHFLGYKKGADSQLEIVPEEAETIRLIYRLFMDGRTEYGIARHLTELGVKTPTGKSVWSQSTVHSILTNEKYKGDARLQKKFTVDFLTKKQKINEGEVPQYYVENSHPAIIEPEEWEQVQREILRRRELGGQYSGSGLFGTKIVCGDCGGFYGAKLWHSTDKYRRTVWQCNRKFQNRHKCGTPSFDEEEIKNRFVFAIKSMVEMKEEVLENCRLILARLSTDRNLNDQLEAVNDELAALADLTERYVLENARAEQNQNEYNKRYAALLKRYEELTAKKEGLTAATQKQKSRRDALSAFMFRLSELGTLEEFDRDLWHAAVQQAVVSGDGSIRFVFVNGQEITV